MTLSAWQIGPQLTIAACSSEFSLYHGWSVLACHIVVMLCWTVHLASGLCLVCNNKHHSWGSFVQCHVCLFFFVVDKCTIVLFRTLLNGKRFLIYCKNINVYAILSI